MSSPASLPDLPLMLAGIPRVVTDLLCAAGLPVSPLQRVALLASGSGRFVLYDSASKASAAQARRAVRQGLLPIDCRALCDMSRWPAMASVPAGSTPSDAPRQFLENLKGELERRGGLWLRLADFPFPFQSAISLVVEHQFDDVDDFGSIVDSLPATATHFVSSRVRGPALASLVQPTPVDLGWRIERDDCETTLRRTLAHWSTRVERFRQVGLNPQGLLCIQPESPLPSRRSLSQLGLRYACHVGQGTACQFEPTGCDPHGAPWIRFGITHAPTSGATVGWVGEHHQSGYPIFLAVTSDRLPPIQELLARVSNEPRFSLMWQPSLGEFSRWWQLRSRMRIQAWRRGAGYEIHAEGDFENAVWGVEIWRGNHMAMIPLRSPTQHVSEDGLVYLRVPKKTFGGCAVPHENVLQLLASVPHQHLAA